MTPSVLVKLQSVLQADFDTARANIMIPNPEGGYHLFGLFDVRETNDTVEVSRHRSVIQEFSSMRLAVSWCIAEKYQQIQLSTQIARLDRDFRRLQNTADTLRLISAHMRNADRRAIARAKTEDSAWRLQQVQHQLAKCVMRAKYLQIRGFNDEIARTRRPAPHRTSRPGHRKSNRSAD